MKVLFLSEWYPHRYDAMSGLFVQKHAYALANHDVDVCVLYLHRDSRIQRLELTDVMQNRVREIRIYYPDNYLHALYKGWKYVHNNWGTPDICQLNVITKNALLALWLKWRTHTPYIIIEHWTGYLPENLSIRTGSLHIKMMQYICRNAEVVMPVSQLLRNAMQALGFRAKRWEQIDNVVDDFFFRKAVTPHNNTKILLNITCFDEPHKNVKGLLAATKVLAYKRQDWRLILIGTGPDYPEVRAYADSLRLPEGLVHWAGEQTPRQVAEWLFQSSAFVLSSRFETYGVVFGEAVAAGVPILSTPVGIADEIGAFIVPQEIAQHKPDTFAKFIEAILWETPPTASINANRFRAETIGEKLKAIYESVLMINSHDENRIA